MILSLLGQDVVPDLVTVGNELTRREQLEAVGGTSYLAGLVDQVPTAANIAHHAEIVKQKAGLRRITEVCTRASERAKSNGMDPGALVADLWEELRPLESPDRMPGPVLVRLQDVTSRPVSWLWDGRIPRGKLTLLVGDPGLGKSFMTMDFAARTSRGAEWPDGTPGQLGDTVILTAEDGLADTVRPRADVQGGDPRRIHVLIGVGDPEKPSSFNLAADLLHLEDAVLRTRARLVVIDPLSAYLGGVDSRVDSHKDSDVRAILAPLTAMAERNDVAVVGVAHLNKSQQRQALYRAQGSLAFVAAARAVFGVAEDQQDPRRRLFVPLKMNVAPRPAGLAFRLDGGRLTWDRGTVSIDADTALGGWEAKAERNEREEAKDFLCEILAGGPVSAKAIKRQAEAAGISERTLKRAKSDFGIVARKRSFAGDDAWIWEVPSKGASSCLLGTPGPLRPSSGELAPFEEGHASEEGHEEGHTIERVAPLGEREQEQQLTSSSDTKNTKEASESEKERPW